MSLNIKIKLFLLGIILHKIVGKARELSELYPSYSHDSFNRMLNATWDSQKRLLESAKELIDPEGGYLILDDTLFEKPYSKEIDGVGWYYDRKNRRYLKGLCVVALIWTDGKRRVPIGFQIYRKGGPSKVEIALKLLSLARNRLGCRPEAVLFDSWYGCKAIFKRLNSYGWKFVCRLKKNRTFNGKQLKYYKPYPFWCEIGYLKGGIRLKVVRHHYLFFATNFLSIDFRKIKELYKVRNLIEEFFRCWKNIFCPAGCQARSYGAQSRFICLTLIAHLALEEVRIKLGVSYYQAAKNLRLKKNRYENLLKKQIERLA